MLKIFTGISTFIYAIILFFSIKCGIFDYEVSWWGRMANDSSHGDYILTILGYLALCFPTFYAMVGTMLSCEEMDFMRIIISIIYAISMIVLAIMILEIGASGLNLSIFIITAFFYFGMRWANEY